jgi:2,5-diketo-D-gluconate reductase A
MGDSAHDVTLRHGARMPRVGLGTGSFPDDEAEYRVADAIALGYRLIDTAFNYHNESGVGRGIVRSGVDRAEVFVTTKFNLEHHGRSLVRDAWAGSASRLGLDYLDLLMVHWPNPWEDRYADAWRGLIDLLEAGLVRAIGVSNFKAAHLQRLFDETGVIPEVNQIQMNPYLSRQSTRAFHDKHRIVTEAWSPLDRGRGLLGEPVVSALAEEYGRTPAQVVLRWHLELGAIPIPRSTHPARMKENLDVFDFRLDQRAVSRLSSLDRGEAHAADSDTMGH